MIVVAKDGSGDFLTINDALKEVEARRIEGARIFIKKGCYEERLEIRTPHLTLLGEDFAETEITGKVGAFDLDQEGVKMGTFRTYTVLVDTHHVRMENLSISNRAGIGVRAGQAIALYADGDALEFVNCRLLGRQDTLFIGPLPPKEIEKNGFLGPKQFSPRINGRQLYEKCYIEGDVDFIFGSGTAFFDQCEIHSLDLGKEINGYVTAASTPEGQEYGFVFHQCHFTGECAPGTVYLGRPWRNFAKTVIIDSVLENHIHPAGWHDWNKEDAKETVFYGEGNNTGVGSKTKERINWLRQIKNEELSAFQKEKVLGEKRA